MANPNVKCIGSGGKESTFDLRSARNITTPPPRDCPHAHKAIVALVIEIAALQRFNFVLLHKSPV